MVERTKSEGFDRFDGKVESIEVEKDDNGRKYHIVIEAIGVEIKGKTGRMHEWIRIPPTATDTSVPEGSVLDKFLQELEVATPEVKKEHNVDTAVRSMTGKKFRFVHKKLGKSFEGYDAREYWTPVLLL